MKAARLTKVSEPYTDTCKHVRLVQWSTQLGSIHTVDTVFAEQGEFMGTRSSCSPVVWTQAASYNAEGEKLKLTPVESGICETGRRRTAKHAEFRCHKAIRRASRRLPVFLNQFLGLEIAPLDH